MVAVLTNTASTSPHFTSLCMQSSNYTLDAKITRAREERKLKVKIFAVLPG